MNGSVSPRPARGRGRLAVPGRSHSPGKESCNPAGIPGTPFRGGGSAHPAGTAGTTNSCSPSIKVGLAPCRTTQLYLIRLHPYSMWRHRRGSGERGGLSRGPPRQGASWRERSTHTHEHTDARRFHMQKYQCTDSLTHILESSYIYMHTYKHNLNIMYLLLRQKKKKSNNTKQYKAILSEAICCRLDRSQNSGHSHSQRRRSWNSFFVTE